MDVFLTTSQKQHVFASQKLIFGISLYRQAKSDILKKVMLFNLAPSGSVSFSCQFSFYIISLFSSSFASLFLNHFLRPKFFYNAHHPFSSLFFLFFLTISHLLGVLMRSCEVTEDIKRVSSSFFFFPSFPRNKGIYKERKWTLIARK